jgi:predicted ATP-grasp superfamily ATP-dependent carboligase
MKDPGAEVPAEGRAGGPRRDPPRILLIVTMPWIFPARLACALRKAGFHVEAVCQFGHPLRHLQTPIRIHRLGWLREAASIKKAIQRTKPDFLVPCDDPSVRSLHYLHRSDRIGNLASLIERSLGNPGGYGVTENRSALVELARSMGLRVPKFEFIADWQDLTRVGGCHAYPCVLKRDKTWSGLGVAVVESEAELGRAWSWIAGWKSILRAGKAALRDRRLRSLLDALITRGATVEAQEFVAGTPANRAVLCRDGQVLAGISVLALQTAYPGGPASAVQVIHHPEMVQTVEALVARLRLSGFCGFDFVISPSGEAHLLELNPRATPVSHLALADGTHLPAALYLEIAASAPVTVADPVNGDLVALFPTEWQRDRASAFLYCAHHDVPWDEPALLAKVGFTEKNEPPKLFPIPATEVHQCLQRRSRPDQSGHWSSSCHRPRETGPPTQDSEAPSKIGCGLS